jgi:hypothetical protein
MLKARDKKLGFYEFVFNITPEANTNIFKSFMIFMVKDK